MTALRLDLEDPTPPYEQLRRQLVDLIEAGALAEGERLPPLRQLARDLGVAVGTVGRTYAELEAGGLVVSRRGAGTRVLARAASTPQERLARDVDSLCERALSWGLTRDDVERAVREWQGPRGR